MTSPWVGHCLPPTSQAQQRVALLMGLEITRPEREGNRYPQTTLHSCYTKCARLRVEESSKPDRCKCSRAESVTGHKVTIVKCGFSALLHQSDRWEHKHTDTYIIVRAGKPSTLPEKPTSLLTLQEPIASRRDVTDHLYEPPKSSHVPSTPGYTSHPSIIPAMPSASL